MLLLVTPASVSRFRDLQCQELPGTQYNVVASKVFAVMEMSRPP